MHLLRTCFQRPDFYANLQTGFVGRHEVELGIIEQKYSPFVGNCQAQPNWLALISVYYRPPTTTTWNSMKMANLEYIEGRMDQYQT